MPLSVGTRLGPYEIVSFIGAGGMGEVYRATDTRLHREVAVKVSVERFSERSEREARAVAALNHPNICALYDVGPNYLVMELVEGPALAERIKAGAIPLDEALNIARQIGDALEAAHEKGIVHRDLKPGNVKIKPDGLVKVLDFGLAKMGGGPETASENSPTLTMNETRAGVVLGTAAYMAPEQARGKQVDKRADIWAFGVVLYEMATGKRLFTGEDLSEVMASVIKEQPQWDAVPARLQRLLKACLEKDPKRRLRDIGDAWRLIEEPTAPIATFPPGSRLGWVSWIAAGVFALTAAGVSLVHFREQPPADPTVHFDIATPDNVAPGPYFSLSPDGRWLAYVGVSNNRGTLWVHDLRTGDSRALTPAGALSTANEGLFWSPDSRFVGFQQGYKLKKVEVSGGPPQLVCDLPVQQFNGGSWNGDDVIVFGSFPLLYKVSANGGTPVAVPSGGASQQEPIHSTPQFLPDGRHFLYLRDQSGSEQSGIYVGSLDAKLGEPLSKRLVTTSWGALYAPGPKPGAGYLLFLREGTLMAQPFDPRGLELTGSAGTVAEQVGNSGGHWGAFSASANGHLVFWHGRGQMRANVQFTWMDQTGKTLGVAGEPGPFLALALSPDGTRAAVARTAQQGNYDIWLLDFSRGGAATRFTLGSGGIDAIWSPDGNRIAFASYTDGVYNLYQKPVNGVQDEELLLKTRESKFPRDWSHDGRFLLFDVSSDPKTKDDIWILPMEGDKKPVPFLRTEFDEYSGRFSPDGHWVTYTSDESGRREVYARAFSPPSGDGSPIAGAKYLISTGGGSDARWREDGKAIYYLARDGKLMAVDVTTSPMFRAGTPRALLQAPAVASTASWDAARDGKRFLFPVPAPVSEQNAPVPFTMVLNWQAGLKE